MTDMKGQEAGDAKQKLPDGWRWVRLGDVCDLNPRRPSDLKRADDAPTVFVPMSAVNERQGAIGRCELRPFVEVQKGYTYFAEGDVLFAKITPCMQNGKHAIARGLIDGIGFGSTEFHVIRPHPEIMAEWLHRFLRQPSVLLAASAHFSGTVGQQRVPDEYLRTLELPLPPLAVQQRVVAILNEQMAAVERARAAAEARLEAAKALFAAYLRAAFDSQEIRGWPSEPLGNVLQLRKEIVHPRDNPEGPATFVGLEHIESVTGRRISSIDLEKAALTGRKPRFYRGDIVYGYLRPYLNKVWVAEFDGLCSVDQYVYSVDQDKANTEFVAWFMRSPDYLRSAPIDTTPGQLPRIRTEEVSSVEIHLPPLGEQQRIVGTLKAQMDMAEGVRKAVTEELAAINVMPAALLRRAFNGEL